MQNSAAAGSRHFIFLELLLAGHFQFLLYRFSPRRAKNDTE
jgi:hypothetical protein